MAQMTVNIWLVLSGEPTFEWCDRCQFSELAVVPVTILDDWGVTPGGTYRRCLRCDPLEAGDG